MLISVGERISCALAAMAINDLGHEAISLTGSQAGIVTDTVHGKAKIVEVRAQRIHEALDHGKIVLVAGFQGVSTELEVTTLGRGGSDTTAVALAAALGADACEIYTDVEGVFTADPRIVPTAASSPRVTYDEMLEMAASGAKVLMLRSVELARNHNVQLHVRSTFSTEEGTWITRGGRTHAGEGDDLGGHAHASRRRSTASRACPRRGCSRALAEASVNVDTIVQTSPEIVFSAPDDRPRGRRARARRARRAVVRDATTSAR